MEGEICTSRKAGKDGKAVRMYNWTAKMKAIHPGTKLARWTLTRPLGMSAPRCIM